MQWPWCRQVGSEYILFCWVMLVMQISFNLFSHFCCRARPEKLCALGCGVGENSRDPEALA